MCPFAMFINMAVFSYVQTCLYDQMLILTFMKNRRCVCSRNDNVKEIEFFSVTKFPHDQVQFSPR